MTPARRQLLLSALEALNTANALRPFARNGYAAVPSFAPGWPTSELPMAAL
ncbi:MAG: hypothetical protein JWP31_2155, partial [Aeromicrobium sp.]|nr:hypothetical protein [Aeromicrobium sp.]